MSRTLLLQDHTRLTLTEIIVVDVIVLPPYMDVLHMNDRIVHGKVSLVQIQTLI